MFEKLHRQNLYKLGCEWEAAREERRARKQTIIDTYGWDSEELKAWYAMSGLPLKKFFNTSGLVYKSLGLKDKLPTMTEEEQLRLLATDGMLVKRPLVIGDDFVLMGFREKEWGAILTNSVVMEF